MTQIIELRTNPGEGLCLVPWAPSAPADRTSLWCRRPSGCECGLPRSRAERTPARIKMQDSLRSKGKTLVLTPLLSAWSASGQPITLYSKNTHFGGGQHQLKIVTSPNLLSAASALAPPPPLHCLSTSTETTRRHRPKNNTTRICHNHGTRGGDGWGEGLVLLSWTHSSCPVSEGRGAEVLRM